ncbi:MAG TPA: peptidylprolyl isomerase [Gemmataceae bacterium]|nr:peptidylprolyl isomerase [Gemmataceae bacterium]
MRSHTRRLGPVLGAVVLLGIGYCLGQTRIDPLAAQSPTKGVVPAASTTAPPAGDRRVIAYVYGSTPITREEFADYLIQQYGKDKVRLFVNRRIIEMAAAKQNVVVTPQEIDAVIQQDCERLGMTREDFIAKILPNKYGMGLEEWRMEVIKPRLILQQMCKKQLKMEEADLKKVYENLYGEKVICQVILWSKDQAQQALRKYDSIRKDEKAFDEAARDQLNSDLAARLGKVDPIGRNSGPGTAKIEELAFSLKDGQVSELIDAGAGVMVIKRLHSIPARTGVTYESVRDSLIKEFTERQIEQEIPKLFAKLSEEAKPLFLLSPRDETTKEIEERSRRLGVDPAMLEPKK